MALIQADDQSNPLFLSHGENPGHVLVSKPLTSSNYHTWSRSMFVALSAKNKLGFITGALPQPAITNPSYCNWMRCNYMVLAWITNCLSPQISTYTLYSDSASQVWSELKRRFSRNSNHGIFMLEQQIIVTKQEGNPISIYFAKLKSTWDEIFVYEESYVCVENPCGVLTAMNKKSENKKIMQFLMGLDDRYHTLRNQILLKRPLPDLDMIFSLMVQEEANQEISVEKPTHIETSAMNVNKGESSPTTFYNKSDHQKSYQRTISYNQKNTSWNKNSQQNSKICSKCDKNNHTIETCYDIYGYPHGHKYARDKPQQGYQRNNKPRANQAGTRESGKGVTLSHDQIQQMMSLFKGMIGNHQGNVISKPIGFDFSSGPSQQQEDWDS